MHSCHAGWQVDVHPSSTYPGLTCVAVHNPSARCFTPIKVLPASFGRVLQPASAGTGAGVVTMSTAACTLLELLPASAIWSVGLLTPGNPGICTGMSPGVLLPTAAWVMYSTDDGGATAAGTAVAVGIKAWLEAAGSCGDGSLSLLLLTGKASPVKLRCTVLGSEMEVAAGLCT